LRPSDLAGSVQKARNRETRTLRETADLIAQLIEARVSARRAHVVGLSYGGSVVFAMLERHHNRVDRAVIDGAAVLPLCGGWGDRFVQLSTTAISPIVNTRPVAALLSLVGLRELGIELSSASPRAFRRAYKEGFTAPTSRAELEAQCPTLLVAGEKEAIVRASNAALAELMPHAIARFVPGLGHAWFGWRARSARAHGRSLADRRSVAGGTRDGTAVAVRCGPSASSARRAAGSRSNTGFRRPRTGGYPNVRPR
jgi:pimeloyl-ACP methyl ester carboxylesterase